MHLQLSNNMSVPIRWVFALLAGCSVFICTAITLGMYFGARDATATELTLRVNKLENEIAVISLVDRRLARIEGALEIKVPREERLPASQ